MSKPLPPNCKEYIRDVRALSRFLDRDEEQRLARLAREGDKAARDTLVASVLPLAISLANWYYRKGENRGMELEDLIQQGNLGVLRAVEKFDPDRGFRLTTYTVAWIRQQIGDELGKGDAHLIRKPKQRETLRPIMSLFATIPRVHQGGDEVTLLHVTPAREDEPPDTAIHDEQMAAVTAAFDKIPERERSVIQDRINGLRLDEIGAKLGVSKERIRQIEKRAVMLLCHALGLPDCGKSIKSLGFNPPKKR